MEGAAPPPVTESRLKDFITAAATGHPCCSLESVIPGYAELIQVALEEAKKRDEFHQQTMEKLDRLIGILEDLRNYLSEKPEEPVRYWYSLHTEDGTEEVSGLTLEEARDYADKHKDKIFELSLPHGKKEIDEI